MMAPGKYDFYAQQLLNELNAQGIILIVVGGNRGSGMSLKADAVLLATLPAVLRHTADMIEAEVADDVRKATQRP